MFKSHKSRGDVKAANSCTTQDWTGPFDSAFKCHNDSTYAFFGPEPIPPLPALHQRSQDPVAGISAASECVAQGCIGISSGSSSGGGDAHVQSHGGVGRGDHTAAA